MSLLAWGNLGIQTRLSLSLGALAALAVAACVVGWVAFGQVRSAVDRITADSMPSIMLVLQIAEGSARITAGAPAIMASGSQEERSVARTALDADISHLQELSTRWSGQSSSASTEGPSSDLNRLVEAFTVHIRSLDEATGRRLETGARRAAAHDALRATHEAYLEALAPLIDDVVFGLVIANERRTAASPDATAATLDALMTLKAEGNLAAGILSESANVPEEDMLTPLMERLEAANGQVQRALRKLPVTPRYEALRTTAGKLLQFGEPGDNILTLRQQELRHLAQARAELDSSRKLSTELRLEADKLVAGTQHASRTAAAGAAQAIASGKLLFLVISAASLSGALLIMAVYVRRRIVRPISDITDTMSRLAEGDTQIDIPGQSRTDELGRMARALEVFRGITVQIQKSNLREIEAARRRLFDAIESISEAFTLFDAKDELVVYNRMYLSMVHPEIREQIKPGITFEDIVRSSIQTGMFPDAVSDPEAWVQHRMEKHRTPGDPHILRREDGNWILVSERRTAEGGYVAVYSDITELKERENELAAQTLTLQNLSTQLSKYLSPQIYQSIFSGQQTARVASRRKKLTVYFSDIAGFTEAADRMESEDLTGLLNEYLTEMAKIALKHGATIDKYVGDAIMIFFGDPASRGVKEDALTCVRMAIEMRNRLKELASIWESRGFSEHLITRTGIHTGFCTVGNFGSEDRMDYTIIGGAVNLASRLEQAAQPGTILISHETYSLVHSEFHCLEHQTLKLKGMAYPVKTYVAVNSHAAMGTQSGHIFEHRANLLLDANLTAMDQKERSQVATTLRRLLSQLEQKDD
jgi:adenylate cyclase